MFATYLSRGRFKSRLIFARIDGSIVVLHEHFAPKRHRLDVSCRFYNKVYASTDKKINMVMLDVVLLQSMKNLDNQLASSLLKTCSKLVLIKPEQAMRTHPDIGLMNTR